MPQRQSVRSQLALQRRPVDAGLDARRARVLVHFEHSVEVEHIDRHGAGITLADCRFDAADGARSATEGNGGGVGTTTPVQQVNHIPLVAGKGDHVGGIGEIPPKGTYLVGQRPAIGVH